MLTEYKSGNGRADYAMVPGSGPPSLVIEAKSLLTPTENAIEQTINYCIQDGIDYFIITNGDDWEAYETHRRGPMQEKLVTAFKITDTNQSTVMGMLWLWRGNFKSGDPVGPVTHTTEDDTDTSDGAGEKALTGDERPGTPLNELTNVTGQNPPQSMTFPDGATKPVGKWNRIQIATVEWLVETGRLNEARSPLTNPRGTYLVHTSPNTKDGKQFSAPVAIKQFWIAAGLSANGQIRRTTQILIAAGVDPATVFVSS